MSELASSAFHHQLSLVRLESLESAAMLLNLRAPPPTAALTLLRHLAVQCALEDNVPVTEQLVLTWNSAAAAALREGDVRLWCLQVLYNVL